MLDIDIEGRLPFDVDDFVGESVAVLGIKGSGKTNTAAVLIEELLPFLPMSIVDPESEYWGLKERFQIMVVGVGHSDHADVTCGVEGAGALAAFSVEQGVSVILDLNDLTTEAAARFLLPYFQALWRAATRVRRPYQVVIEEAHEFLPQGARSDLKGVITRLALRGRKRGLGAVLVSQRSAKVEKDALTQADVLFLHRVVHPADLHVYEDLIPLPTREVGEQVRALATGQALVVRRDWVQAVRVRQRHTFHAGATPGLDDRSAPELRRVDAALLAELQALLGTQAVPGDDPEQTALRRQVAGLEAALASKDTRIAELEAEVGRLRVQVGVLDSLELLLVTQPQPVATLDVEQIHAGQIVAGAPPATPGEGDDAPSAPVDPLPYRSPTATVRAIRRQERGFAALLGDVARLPRPQKRVLAYLLDHEGVALTVRQLARYVGYSESTLRNRPPLDLLAWGLLRREGRPGERRYAASARATLAERFPDLDVDTLIDRLASQTDR